MSTELQKNVGSRVLIIKDRATVRYVGEVSGQQGTWVGVEWDDPTRGKHDGSTGGVRYFTALGGPTAGSFIREEKVNWGCSVADALRSRYNNEIAESLEDDVDESEMYVHTVRKHKVPINMVGADKITAQQSQTQRLVSARVVGFGVSHLGSAEDLRETAPQLTELDLTSNLISSWTFAETLAEALPGLQVLNLSDNALEIPRSVPSLPASTALTNLRALVLNNIVGGLSWCDLVTLLEPQLPGLQELHVAGNAITSLAPSAAEAEGGGWQLLQGFQKLQVLNLEDNRLSDWREVQRLRALPALQRLHLNNNPLAGVAEAQEEGGWASLQALYLAGCQLATWADVDALDVGHFPALQEVRLSGNPVLQLSKRGGRFEIIGRISGLTMVNGSAVKPRERRDAEIRYLQVALSEMDAAPDADAREAAAAGHPRLKALMAAYGDEVVCTAAPSAQASTLAASMVELKLTCVAVAQGAKMGTQVKKLPRSLPLGAVRLLCEKLFKVKASQQALFLKDSSDPMPVEIAGPWLNGGTLQDDNDPKPLSFFGVQDGHELLIDQVDAAERESSRAAAKAQAAQAAEERLVAQTRTAETLHAEFTRSMGIAHAQQ